MADGCELVAAEEAAMASGAGRWHKTAWDTVEVAKIDGMKLGNAISPWAVVRLESSVRTTASRIDCLMSVLTRMALTAEA